jgi:hypothetical protein
MDIHLQRPLDGWDDAMAWRTSFQEVAAGPGKSGGLSNNHQGPYG